MNTLKKVEHAARRRVQIEQDFRARVIEAHRAGESLRAIAKAAGLTHPRILQIVREG